MAWVASSMMTILYLRICSRSSSPAPAHVAHTTCTAFARSICSASTSESVICDLFRLGGACNRHVVHAASRQGRPSLVSVNLCKTLQPPSQPKHPVLAASLQRALLTFPQLPAHINISPQYCLNVMKL